MIGEEEKSISQIYCFMNLVTAIGCMSVISHAASQRLTDIVVRYSEISETGEPLSNVPICLQHYFRYGKVHHTVPDVCGRVGRGTERSNALFVFL